DGVVPDERRRRPSLVRISLPADGVDRSVPDYRALDRRRSPRAHAARAAAMDARAAGPLGAQALSLADGGVVDRRRLGALLRGRADPGERPGDISGAVCRLRVDRHSDVHDLCARRPYARAGLSLYVSMAAYPGSVDR